MADGGVTLDILTMVKDRRVTYLRRELDDQEEVIRQAALDGRWECIESTLGQRHDYRLRISELQALFQTAEYEVTKQEQIATAKEQVG